MKTLASELFQRPQLSPETCNGEHIMITFWQKTCASHRTTYAPPVHTWFGNRRANSTLTWRCCNSGGSANVWHWPEIRSKVRTCARTPCWCYISEKKRTRALFSVNISLKDALVCKGYLPAVIWTDEVNFTVSHFTPSNFFRIGWVGDWVGGRKSTRVFCGVKCQSGGAHSNVFLFHNLKIKNPAKFCSFGVVYWVSASL